MMLTWQDTCVTKAGKVAKLGECKRCSYACCVRGRRKIKQVRKKEEKKFSHGVSTLDSWRTSPIWFSLVMAVEPMKRIVFVGCSMLMFLANNTKTFIYIEDFYNLQPIQRSKKIECKHLNYQGSIFPRTLQPSLFRKAKFRQLGSQLLLHVNMQSHCMELLCKYFMTPNNN
jgi:hypothetical protein